MDWMQRVSRFALVRNTAKVWIRTLRRGRWVFDRGKEGLWVRWSLGRLRKRWKKATELW